MGDLLRNEAPEGGEGRGLSLSPAAAHLGCVDEDLTMTDHKADWAPLDSISGTLLFADASPKMISEQAVFRLEDAATIERTQARILTLAYAARVSP